MLGKNDKYSLSCGRFYHVFTVSVIPPPFEPQFVHRTWFYTCPIIPPDVRLGHHRFHKAVNKAKSGQRGDDDLNCGIMQTCCLKNKGVECGLSKMHFFVANLMSTVALGFILESNGNKTIC